MLGNNYAPEFFDGIPGKAGDPLKRICEETLEDLEGYKTILQQFGVEVIQPDMDPNERFLDNPHRYPRGPLQVRDFQLVIGNNCLISGNDHPSIAQTLLKYAPEHTYRTKQIVRSIAMPEFIYDQYAGADWPSYEYYYTNYRDESCFLPFVWQELEEIVWDPSLIIGGANCFMIGTRLYQNQHHLKPAELEFIENLTHFKDFNVYWHEYDGHGDGCFHTIKPGAILSLHDVQTYDETFPGWDVCYLPDQSWSKVENFLQLKYKNKGKWWLAGEEDNDEFTNFVETWLQDWVGYVEETVFDVNVLVLDEHHVCVSNPHNEQVNAFLKKHNMEPVYVPWRHRYFWDGGLHCITLDLYREGTQKDYFG